MLYEPAVIQFWRCKTAKANIHIAYTQQTLHGSVHKNTLHIQQYKQYCEHTMECTSQGLGPIS